MSIRTFASRRAVISAANFQAEMEAGQRCQAGARSVRDDETVAVARSCDARLYVYQFRGRCVADVHDQSMGSPISDRRPFVSISHEVWQDILSFPFPRLVPRQFSVDLPRWIRVVLLDCLPVRSPMEACCSLRRGTGDPTAGESRNRKPGKSTLPVRAFGRSRPAADASREVVERWLLDGL